MVSPNILVSKYHTKAADSKSSSLRRNRPDDNIMRGYTPLSALMGTYPEVAIFRRFGPLNAKNLLYLQAELVTLERELNEVARMDESSGHPDRSIYERDWQTLAEPIEVEGRDDTQWQLFLKVRAKLKEYNAALLEQAQVAKLTRPTKSNLKFLVDFMKITWMGNIYLLGADSDIWENPDMPDLVSLGPEQSNNVVLKTISDSAAGWFHRLIGRKFKKPKDEETLPNTVAYSQAGLERVSTLVMTTISSILPIISTVVLYSVESMSKRLGLAGLFTALFSVMLGLFTSGRPIEIFSATAAFAAVQVVFVGTTSNSS